MYEKKRVAAFAKERSEEPGYDEIPMRSAVLNYILHAAIIVVAASTSLPEVVVCLAALRMGAVDLAIGNLLGSNIFNIGLILAADDIFFTPGPILSYVDPSHAVSAISHGTNDNNFLSYVE